MISRYQSELAAARSGLANTARRIANTAVGPIEYLSFGSGSPVIWIHGVAGGCDQGPAWSRAFLGEDFRVIAVSRFGYLGSPLAAESSPSAQADLFAALLDELGIDRVALVASSAGTSSAFRFAERHGARCSSLVVWSMAVPPYEVPPRPLRTVLRGFFGSDFLFWATFAFISPIRRRLMGIPRDVERRLSSEEQLFADEAQKSFLPVSLRVDGIMNDICVSNPDLNEASALESIDAPTLIIHARDDPWGSFAGAREMAACIPGARFEGIGSGGHLLLGNRDHVGTLVVEFISGNETS